MATLVRDGVKLEFAEAGSGEPAIVFIHGWCCDRNYWQPQFDHYQRDHRVLAVDLRGHGASDRPESDDYSIAGFADDVAWLCGQLGITRPVIAGHSMGGVIALEIAARFPGLPAAVALFDSPVCVPAVLLESDRITGLMAALASPDYVAAAQAFVAGMFIEQDGKELAQRTIAAMSSAPQHVMSRALKETLFYDSETALQKCTVPLLFVGADSPPADVARLKSLRPDAIVGQTVGSGHFHQLEVPRQINAMLDRFLGIVARSAVSV